MTLRVVPPLVGGVGATLLLFLALALLTARPAPPLSPVYPDAVALVYDTPPEPVDSVDTAIMAATTAPAQPPLFPVPPPVPELPVPSLPPAISPAMTAPQNPALDFALPVGIVPDTGGVGSGIYDEAHVDEPPRAVFTTPPDYPYAARRRGISGTVVLRLVVERDGSVGLVEIVSAQPPGVFEDSARLAVAGWRFAPGMRHGKPVRTWVRLPVTFSME
ncbi:MAG: energy transducer TonB [Desulfovibrionaceae bacterium]